MDNRLRNWNLKFNILNICKLPTWKNTSLEIILIQFSKSPDFAIIWDLQLRGFSVLMIIVNVTVNFKQFWGKLRKFLLK